MKPAYNEVVRRTFFCNGQPVHSVLSGRPGDDVPYYTHAIIDRSNGAEVMLDYMQGVGNSTRARV